MRWDEMGLDQIRLDQIRLDRLDESYPLGNREEACLALPVRVPCNTHTTIHATYY